MEWLSHQIIHIEIHFKKSKGNSNSKINQNTCKKKKK